jgi:hypothetical protein
VEKIDWIVVTLFTGSCFLTIVFLVLTVMTK